MVPCHNVGTFWSSPTIIPSPKKDLKPFEAQPQLEWMSCCHLKIFMPHLHWQSFWLKTSAILRHDCAACTCPGRLGWRCTSRIISIWVLSPNVAKANIVLSFACHCHQWFYKNFANVNAPLSTVYIMAKIVLSKRGLKMHDFLSFKPH